MVDIRELKYYEGMVQELTLKIEETKVVKEIKLLKSQRASVKKRIKFIKEIN